MTVDLNQLFVLSGRTVAPIWLLLIVAPRWRWTQRLATFFVPVLLAPVYGLLLIHALPISGAGFGTFSQVSRMFASPEILLAGWVHYLVGDLFVGAWETRDALKSGISRWLLAPCLALTFLVGPIGLMLYLLLRLSLRKTITDT